MSITDMNDSLSNLIFNRKTITKNKGARGVIFKEVRNKLKSLTNG